MLNADQQKEFIRLRAEGKSYATISKQMGISKSTCSKLENQLKEAISSLKAEQLQELYDTYHMGKEARIKNLGDTLSKIDNALADVDLSEIPGEKLLDFKLKYEEALKDEYIPVGTATPLRDNFTVHDVLAAFADLLNRVRAGEVTQEQANKESSILSSMLRAYEAVELKTKIDTLEAIIGGR